MRTHARSKESGNSNRTFVITSLALVTAAGGWWYCHRPADPEKEMLQRFQAARVIVNQEVPEPDGPIVNPSAPEPDPGSDTIVVTQPDPHQGRKVIRARAAAIP